LTTLKDMLERYRTLESQVDQEASELAASIQALAAELELANAQPAWSDDAPAQIQRINHAVLELAYTYDPRGVARGWAAAERDRFGAEPGHLCQGLA